MTDLAQHIASIRLIDTHEHLQKEADYLARPPDVLVDLFENYIKADLIVAGAPIAAVERLVNTTDPDIAGRFAGVQEAWACCQQTGYGEAVRLIGRLCYDLEELTPASLAAAQGRAARLRQPGERLRLLRDVALLDHVQTDDFQWRCAPDQSGPDFFLYDLSWVDFCAGRFDVQQIAREVGVAVTSLASLDAAMAAIFARYAPCAIAVKAQHAYERTLLWQERRADEVAPVLDKYLAGRDLSTDERLCLGDWCWARGTELAIEHNLPFKLHTGYYAGQGRMPVDRIKGGNLCALLLRYPQARFVLMHIAYPYQDELVALAKHYPNVYVDLCWAWSIDPRAAGLFVRQFIHAVPANKLFAFGGDTGFPGGALAYAHQARQWLTRALQAEVDDRLLTAREAIALATRFMRTNQEACFDLAGTRAAIQTSIVES